MMAHQDNITMSERNRLIAEKVLKQSLEDRYIRSYNALEAPVTNKKPKKVSKDRQRVKESVKRQFGNCIKRLK